MSTSRTIVIPGGAGFLGRCVARFFAAEGWRVVVLSRRDDGEVPGAETLAWDGKTQAGWARALDGAEVVLNLAGRSVNCRYNARNREEIEQSRVQSTRAIGQATATAHRPPRVWLNSSTATIYRHAEDRPQDEHTGEIGSGFSVNVARAWEAAFLEAPTPGVRKAALRTAMVMGPGRGGPFNVFLTLSRFGLGGRMGPGTQYVSWVHIDDFCRALRFLIDRDELDGCINIASPDPLPNAQFMQHLRHAAGVRIGLPAARWMLEVGAFILRTETELPLKSRRVVPARLLEAGFDFQHPHWPAAWVQATALKTAEAVWRRMTAPWAATVPAWPLDPYSHTQSRAIRTASFSAMNAYGTGTAHSSALRRLSARAAAASTSSPKFPSGSAAMAPLPGIQLRALCA
jgi:uncharacterized protein